MGGMEKAFRKEFVILNEIVSRGLREKRTS
jgi:hypothetical protein